MGTQHPPMNAGGPKMTGAMKLAQPGYLILFVNSTAKKKSLSTKSWSIHVRFEMKIYLKTTNNKHKLFSSSIFKVTHVRARWPWG